MNSDITVYGADWCGDTLRTLRQLDRLDVNYDYINIDNDRDGEQKVIQHNKGKRRIPLVEIASEAQLSVPSEQELEKELRSRGFVESSE
jgi:glutaredoxin